jgi:hypothetical protein
MGLHEIKNFFTTKEIVCKIKMVPTEWEKIFASYTRDRQPEYTGSSTYKLPKNQCPNEEMANDLNRAFSKEGVHMSNKHMKIFSATLFTMQSTSLLLR